MYLIVAILIAIIILIVSLRAFAAPPPAADSFVNLIACPGTLRQYNDGKSVSCCEGDSDGRKCYGTPKCSLSANTDLPTCATYIKTYFAEKAAAFCPTSMPNYYEIDGRGYCTSAALKSDYSGPLTTSAKFCDVLATPEQRLNSPKSCLNSRRLESMKVTVTGDQVAKNIQSSGKSPALLMANYVENLVPKTCYDRASMEQYLDFTKPQWRSDKGWRDSMNKSVIFCDGSQL